MKTEYAIVLYFDDETSWRIQAIIDDIAAATGNEYMTANRIQPHITIGDFFTKEDAVTEKVEVSLQDLYAGKILFDALSSFSPYVLYIKPTINDYLSTMNSEVNKVISNTGYEVNELYIDSNWIPHLTIATKLTYKQLENARLVANSKFESFYGYAKKIALARCNPYREIKCWDLKG